MKNIFRMIGIIALVAIIGFGFIGCKDSTDDNGETPTYKAVTDITGIPTLKQMSVDLTLNGVVVPSDATNKTIVWSIAADDDESTSPSLDGNVLTTETVGTVKLLATIANGLTASTPFTKTFTINVQEDPVAVDISEIEGVYAPEADGIPSTIITATDQFTGTISWNGNPAKFLPRTVYTATITLTAKDGYTFKGVDANFFNVLGATTTNAANSGVVTAVFPATGGTQAEELVAKWFDNKANSNTQTGNPVYEFTADGKLLINGATTSDWTYITNGNTITFTNTAGGGSTLVTTAKFLVYGTTLTLYDKSGDAVNTPINGIYFKQGTSASAIGSGDIDYTTGTQVSTFNVRNALEWEAVRRYIATNGDDKNYIINIVGTVTVGGTNSNTYKNDLGDTVYQTFRQAQNIKVALRGSGTLALSAEPLQNGALITTGSYQTITLHNLTLTGDSINNDALVVVHGDNSSIIMHSGKISGNTNLENSDVNYFGGGVRIRNATDAQFIMHNGEISGNTANKGGGVYNQASFTIHGGTISGNFAVADGGGVFGNMQISGGIIYGTDLLASPATENNATGTGDSLNGTATVGTFASGTFTPNAITINTTDETIMVNNGSIKYSDIGNPPADMLENVWYTSQDNANKRVEDGMIEFLDNGRIHVKGLYTGLTYTVDGTTLTVRNSSLRVTETRTIARTDTGTGNDREIKMALTGSGTLLAQAYFLPNPDYIPSFDITTGGEWTAALTYANGKSGKININILNNISVTGVSSNTVAAAGNTLEITIKGVGEVRTMSLSSSGAIIRPGSGTTVILEENLTLQGISGNTLPVIQVTSGSTVIMNDGVRVTGNSASYGYGGGVNVYGTFIMNGGEITGNTDSYGNGGGVYLQSSGAFTMNGGTISNNTAIGSDIANGGGVFISNATFTMNGGTISNNTARTTIGNASANGGGVYVNFDATFNMNGGTISGNNANAASYRYGGGVFCGGTFRMSNGTIHGNTGATPNSANSGASLYVGSGTATYGPSGTGTNLSTTNNTIRVVNGVLQ